ncbi:MAG: PEP-CTERM sorting domain-containing protein [Armatimonadetes bacterium]|nr:PEP-CTERM sorting domain-containing protein [Armatimonadota bacterium]
MRKYVLMLALAMPLTAAAQFFDHFEGNELAGHWRFFSEGTQWEHNVSDSMLHVTRLFGGPPGLRQVYLFARLDPLADFEMTVLMGWDEAEFHRLQVRILRSLALPSFSSIGVVNYEARPSWETPLATAWFNGAGSNSIPAPRSGMHEFRMARTGDSMTAHFDGQLIHQGSGVVTDEARWVMFEFVSDEDLQFAPLHVDMIQLVPEPATFVILGIGAICAMLRRRR